MPILRVIHAITASTLLGIIPRSLPDLDLMWRILASPISGSSFGAGFCAAFYIVPLQALLQRLAPSEKAGRLFGTANGITRPETLAP